MSPLVRTVTVFTRGSEIRVYTGPVDPLPGWKQYNEVPVQDARRERRRGPSDRRRGRPEERGAEVE